MSTFGAPNAVGRNLSPVGINPQVAAQTQQIAPPEQPQRPGARPAAQAGAGGLLGVGGAAATYRAIRPNKSGQQKRAQQRVKDLDARIANERRFAKPNQGLISQMNAQRQRAASAVNITNKVTAARHTPKIRMRRGAIGAAGLAGSAALLRPFMPKQPKQPKQPGSS